MQLYALYFKVAKHIMYTVYTHTEFTVYMDYSVHILQSTENSAFQTVVSDLRENMGCDLEQYRSAIGSFAATNKKQKLFNPPKKFSST